MINEKIEKCLAFVRYAINPEVFEAPEMSDKDWKRLYKFALKQAIIGVVVEGVERLKTQVIKPPREVMVKWISQTLNLEKYNRRMNKTIVKLFAQLEEDGFKCCLLKGQGNNLLYPNAYRRTSGDIDVWLANAGDGETKTDIKRIIKYVKSHSTKGRAVYHHIDYGEFEGIEVEVHYRPSFMNNLLYNHRLQQWFIQQADAQFANRKELPDQAGTIAIPTPEFNAVYQLAHINTHVINMGVGLRHVIDYYYVMLALKDKQGLEHTLQHLGLDKIAGAMMWVLHEMLGLEDRYLIVPKDEQLGRVLATEILRDGNFGRFLKAGKNQQKEEHITPWQPWIRKNTRRMAVDLRMMRYFPSECLNEPIFRIYHFFWRITNGLNL